MSVLAVSLQNFGKINAPAMRRKRIRSASQAVWCFYACLYSGHIHDYSLPETGLECDWHKIYGMAASPDGCPNNAIMALRSKAEGAQTSD